MLARALFLRLSQIISTVLGVYIVLLGGTFHVRNEPSLALTYFIVGGFLLLVAALLYLVIRHFDAELVAEAAWIIYPSGIAFSLVGAFYFAVYLGEHLGAMRREHHTLYLAGFILSAYFIFRMFDIKWLKSARSVYRGSYRRPSFLRKWWNTR